MAQRFTELSDVDSAMRIEMESAEVTLTDSYQSIPLPIDSKLNTSTILTRAFLDRFPERLIVIKNTDASNPLKYQIEWSAEAAPDNGTASHWAGIPNKQDLVLDTTTKIAFETSSRAPYTGMRIRCKNSTPGSNSKVVIIVCIAKWKG